MTWDPGLGSRVALIGWEWARDLVSPLGFSSRTLLEVLEENTSFSFWSLWDRM